MAVLYPPIQPYHYEHIAVSETHKIYIEQCGNPNGIPIVFLHGGPGAGCSEQDRQFFDPDKYRIILFDQRGCGRSTPIGCIEDNTTPALLSDIESIRQHLSIEQWALFGGSWGSTLALLYAQQNTQRVTGMILRGVYFATRDENRWLWQEGMSRFYPEAYQRYRSFISEDKQEDLIAAYYELLTGNNDALKIQAGVEIMRWEMAAISMHQEVSASFGHKLDWHQGLIETHFMAHDCFIEEGQIESNLPQLNQIYTQIIQGRFDAITTPQVAYRLHRSLANSELQMIQYAAHSSREPDTIIALIAATNNLANKLSQFLSENGG